MPINFDAGVPATLEEAIDRVAASMTEDERAAFAFTGAEGAHFWLGALIRGGWGLWCRPYTIAKGAKLTEHFVKRFGLGHADDISNLILLGVELKLNPHLGDPGIALQARANELKQFWIDEGRDPVTQLLMRGSRPVRVDIPVA